MAPTTDLKSEREIARQATHDAAIVVNRLRNEYSAGMGDLVKLEVEAKRLAELARSQTAENAKLAEIRRVRKRLLQVGDELRGMADLEAKLIEQHTAACKVLKGKYEAFAAQSPGGLRLSASGDLKAMGVSLDPLPDLVARAAGKVAGMINELAEKGI